MAKAKIVATGHLSKIIWGKEILVCFLRYAIINASQKEKIRYTSHFDPSTRRRTQHFIYAKGYLRLFVSYVGARKMGLYLLTRSCWVCIDILYFSSWSPLSQIYSCAHVKRHLSVKTLAEGIYIDKRLSLTRTNSTCIPIFVAECECRRLL